jgi:hypothetical protein
MDILIAANACHPNHLQAEIDCGITKQIRHLASGRFYPSNFGMKRRLTKPVVHHG